MSWYPLYMRLCGLPGLVWTGVENLTSTRIQSLNPPAHSKLLYQLHMPTIQTEHFSKHSCCTNMFSSFWTTTCISKLSTITLRCVIPVVCVTNEREESVVKQHNLFRKMCSNNETTLRRVYIYRLFLIVET